MTLKKRSYTVTEIDQMREAIIRRHWCSCIFENSTTWTRIGSVGAFTDTEKIKCVEEMLRTYMFAGVNPKEQINL